MEIASLGIAACSALIAVWSLTRSYKANKIAKRAIELSEESNAIAQRGESRDVEHHDVHWTGSWKSPGTWLYVNAGTDDARQVRATITVDGEVQHAERELVSPGGEITLNLPLSAMEHAKAVEASRVKDLGGGIFQVRPPAPGHDQHRISERIVWVSALGRPQVHQPPERRGTLTKG